MILHPSHSVLHTMQRILPDLLLQLNVMIKENLIHATIAEKFKKSILVQILSVIRLIVTCAFKFARKVGFRTCLDILRTKRMETVIFFLNSMQNHISQNRKWNGFSFLFFFLVRPDNMYLFVYQNDLFEMKYSH